MELVILSIERVWGATALWLPPCNQPLWLFHTQQALIATFIWCYSHPVRCCSGTFVKNCRGHPWNKVRNGLTWGLMSRCHWELYGRNDNGRERVRTRKIITASLCNHNLGYEYKRYNIGTNYIPWLKIRELQWRIQLQADDADSLFGTLTPRSIERCGEDSRCRI